MIPYFTKFVVPIALAIALVGWLFGWWERLRRKRKEAAASSKRFGILVATLRRDLKGRHSAHVQHSLKAHFCALPSNGTRMQVAAHPEMLAAGPVETPTALASVEAKGRKWLWQVQADLLIWGEVDAEGKVLRLRFVAAAPSTIKYPPVKDVELPASFGPEYAGLLAAIAAIAIQPSDASAHARLTALIATNLTKLRSLAEEPPAHFSTADRARVWHTYAQCERRLDEEHSDSARLNAAILHLHKLLEVWTRERDPLDWAATQYNLGNALLRLGEREADMARLEEAAGAFREALLVYTRLRVPLEWAAIENNLGLALWRLGEYAEGTERLEEAVTFFRAALEVRTRERYPLEWAATQNSLGAALAALGARETGTARLEEAAAAYREALPERLRERGPLDWAATQNNLGTALIRLGMREKSVERLEEGIAAFRAALRERTRERCPLEWAATQNNLGTAFAVLGEQENSILPLREAVTAFQATLQIYTRESAPLEWAGTQNNLGSALALLGEREGGMTRLEEAVAAYRAALQEYTRSRSPLQWSEIQTGLGATFASLGELEADAARHSEAVAVRQNWARERVPFDRAMTQNNLGMALCTLAQRQTRADTELACRTLVAAREVMMGALEVRRQAGTSEEVEESQRNLTDIDTAMAALGCGWSPPQGG